MDMSTIYEQLELPPAPEKFRWRVAARVDGELQGFIVEAITYSEAFDIVKRDVPKATGIIILMH